MVLPPERAAPTLTARCQWRERATVRVPARAPVPVQVQAPGQLTHRLHTKMRRCRRRAPLRRLPCPRPSLEHGVDCSSATTSPDNKAWGGRGLQAYHAARAVAEEELSRGSWRLQRTGALPLLHAACTQSHGSDSIQVGALSINPKSIIQQRMHGVPAILTVAVGLPLRSPRQRRATFTATLTAKPRAQYHTTSSSARLAPRRRTAGPRCCRPMPPAA